MVELAPAVEPPPVWVGNASSVAIRRAARLGDGWFPSLISPEEVATGRARLAELASGYGRRTPLIAIGGTSALGTGDGLPTREEIATGISGAYGRPLDEVLDIPLTGSPEQAAERLAAYREAGASHAVIGIAALRLAHPGRRPRPDPRPPALTSPPGHPAPTRASAPGRTTSYADLDTGVTASAGRGGAASSR